MPSNVSSNVYITSHQVNCILIIHAFSKVYTIVLQLLHNLPMNPNVIASKLYIDGHESKPANSNFSKKILFDKFEGNTFLHNVLKNLVPSMSLYPSFRQLSKPAISHRDTFQRNKTD